MKRKSSLHPDGNREIEVRFLHIDKEALIKKLHSIGAKDEGEDFLKELIFYDKERKWLSEHKFARIRETKNGVKLCYKHHQEQSATGTLELEITIDNAAKAKQLLEELGLQMFRHQEKMRHTFTLKNVSIDIDTWPSMPPYVELEGYTEQELKETAKLLGFSWKDVVFENAKTVIEKYYHIPVSTLTYFTFDKIE